MILRLDCTASNKAYAFNSDSVTCITPEEDKFILVYTADNKDAYMIEHDFEVAVTKWKRALGE